MTCTRPVSLAMGQLVPCGRCIACRINKGQQWSARLIHELESWDKSSFVTLTYRPEERPSGLFKSHLQLFQKALRNEGLKFRYYAVGEYGDINGHPHYHGIYFGLGMEDERVVESCWKRGFVYVGSVTPHSINYVCSYVNKKLYGPQAKEVYAGRAAPFSLMSKGLGLVWAKQHESEILSHLGLKREGRVYSAPRYYFKKLSEVPVAVWNEAKLAKAAERDARVGAPDPQALEAWKKRKERAHQSELNYAAKPKGPKTL